MTLSTESVPTYGGVPVRNAWHMQLYAWNRQTQWPLWQADAEAAPSLTALTATVLARLLEQRLRIGLGREYVPVEQPLRGIRGRIHFSRSLRERRFERGQAICTFTSFEANAPRNRIIRSVLHRLVMSGDFGASGEGERWRGKLRRLTRALHEIDLMEVDAATIQRQRLGRNDADYAMMLMICDLAVRSLMPTDTHAGRRAPKAAWERRALERLFQDFIPAFARHHLPSWGVQTEPQWSWHGDSPLLPIMKPDVAFRADGRIAILDTKFTRNPLVTNQYGALRFNTSHLYQIYAYLRTQEHLDPAFTSATGVLLYPQVSTRLRETFHLHDHRVIVATLDLSQPWHDVERELLELFATMHASETPSPDSRLS
jgi:5-methylcytosine-specific restriction enzyme subunit McrC